MNVQLILTLVLIGVAAAYLLQRAWLTWRAMKGGGCGGGCGCPSTAKNAAKQGPVLIPAEQLTLRRRQDRADGRPTPH